MLIFYHFIRLIGKYVEAYHDFQNACKLDCDEITIEWKKEVEPNVCISAIFL